MSVKNLFQRIVLISILFVAIAGQAQNPFVTHRFTADPTARVFNDTLFVYPSSDTICSQEQSNNGFCMHNYHVYSTTDMTNWTDHGEIISHNNVPWVKPESYGMWAPDCNYKNGKYYFYFPAMPKDESHFRNIGVATADHPAGPYTPEPDYIKGVTGIDPNVFVDDDGKAYLYFGGGEKLYGVELNEDMVSVKGKPIVIQELPAKYKEGPFLFKRNGIYYFTFPHAPEGSEEIAYATGDNPLGPFKYQGRVLERWKDGCWTNHHSFVEYKNQWYLFYHSMDISGNQHRRSVCVDKIYFDENGMIPEIKATKRGVGRMYAKDVLQIDRYSILENGKVERTAHDFVNWIVRGVSEETVLGFNEVEFDRSKYTDVLAYVSSANRGGKMLMYDGDDNLLAEFILPAMLPGEWKGIKTKMLAKPKGMVDLTFRFEGNVEDLKVDWIKFIPKGQLAFTKAYNLELECKGTPVLTDGMNVAVGPHKAFTFNSMKVVNKDEIEQLNIYQNESSIERLVKWKKADVINMTSVKKQVYYNPFEKVVADQCSDQNGIVFQNSSIGGQNAAFIENNDNLIFGNLKYQKTPRVIDVVVASQDASGIVEVRKNGREGELLATLNVEPTGGFQSWKTISAELSGEISENDRLYLIFKGGKGFLFNVHSFQFK